MDPPNKEDTMQDANPKDYKHAIYTSDDGTVEHVLTPAGFAHLSDDELMKVGQNVAALHLLPLRGVWIAVPANWSE